MNADFPLFISNFDLCFVYYGNQLDLFGMQDGVSVQMLSYSRHPIFSFDSFFFQPKFKRLLMASLIYKFCKNHTTRHEPSCSPLLAESASKVERTGTLEVSHEVDAMAAILTGVLLALVHILLARGA
jgi:hypothetical protein